VNEATSKTLVIAKKVFSQIYQLSFSTAYRRATKAVTDYSPQGSNQS